MAVLPSVTINTVYQALALGGETVNALRAPRMPGQLSELRYAEAQLEHKVNWIDRLAQVERTAYIRGLMQEVLTKG